MMSLLALNAMEGVECYAKRGASVGEYYAALDRVLDAKPVITVDDGMDLIHRIHTKRTDLIPTVIGGCEETTTGVHRLRAMARDKQLRFPVIAVNDTPMKRFFDNVHGTGESALTAIMVTTNVLMAGKCVVVAGYGFCGRGLARKLHGLGARVVVTEIDARRALEAYMDGFLVMPMDDAAKIGEIFITTTGNTSVIAGHHISRMRDGVILANAGHFNIEIDVKWLEEHADRIERRDGIDSYQLGKKAGACACRGEACQSCHPEGNGTSRGSDGPEFCPPGAFSTLYRRTWAEDSVRGVFNVPEAIDEEVARTKLLALGITIDALTPEQEHYMGSWSEGT